MSRSVNKIILVGNVGRDPEVRETKTGKRVANFSLATNRKVSGGEEQRTEWHRLVCWNALAQLAEDYITTGDRLYVEGRVEYDSWERDGVTIPSVEIHVQELVMLSGSRAEAA